MVVVDGGTLGCKGGSKVSLRPYLIKQAPGGPLVRALRIRKHTAPYPTNSPPRLIPSCGGLGPMLSIRIEPIKPAKSSLSPNDFWCSRTGHFCIGPRFGTK